MILAKQLTDADVAVHYLMSLLCIGQNGQGPGAHGRLGGHRMPRYPLQSDGSRYRLIQDADREPRRARDV